ncbi:mechanosensitive ion channel domain-containing protein [Erythrobacter sp.]|uniref:mechanosensitive ion channel domain-containing protein n=1 Tax=Erythrobacter sp. TaxID=1042 RepID=UPI001B0C0ADD|nr:mechanosensitive ion channel domain-containing protein [Erythrobacter sp.]MBO6528282.1 mechanosensitive ion channel family protein [Erythrobacter sp.]MBO6531372.1 mechanosensitive ion channel family protein [Erythrobacter sp.]
MNLRGLVDSLSSDILASLALMAGLTLVQLLVRRAFKRRDTMLEQVRRRWVSSSRNALILIALVGLVMIWAPQLRTFALSLTAVAVAVVIATKEILLCLSGSMLRAFARAYVVGDIIELGPFRGEVLDYDLLVTRLREFEPREGSMIPTGAEVNLPHSMLFTSPVRVIPVRGGRPSHTIAMVFEPQTNIYALTAEIEGAAKGALETIEQATHKATSFATTEIGKQQVIVQISARTKDLPRAENAVICAMGDLIHRNRARGGRARELHH